MGNGVDVTPGADAIDETFNGFELGIGASLGPIAGAGYEYSYGQHGNPYERGPGFCFKGSGQAKANVGPGEYNFMKRKSPSSTSRTPTTGSGL